MVRTMDKPLNAKRINKCVEKTNLDQAREANRPGESIDSSLRHHRVRKKGSKTGERIATALAENPLFQERLSLLIESSVAAVEKLLGNAKSRPHRAVTTRQPPSQVKLEGGRALQMMQQLLGFLRETTTQAIAAGLVRDRKGMLRIDEATEQRRLLQKRQEGFRDSRDTSIYALDPFHRDDVLRKWR